MRLTVVMPVFNEEGTVEACLQRLFEVDLGMELEVVAVDDGSTDRSLQILETVARTRPQVRVIRHSRNQGKGAALRTGFQAATGDVVAVQDADLEYHPADLPGLLEPILDGRADVVFGSRFRGGTHRVHLFIHYLANRFLTFLSNLLTDLNLTDMETCYKVLSRRVVERLDLRSRGFAVESELTAKVARMGARVYEAPVSYSGRDYSEGKKIRWTDGVATLWAILRFNLFPGKIRRLERPSPGGPDGSPG